MRLSDLLRCQVVDAAGEDIGRVFDALLVQDGPVVGGFGAQLRVEGITIDRASVGIRLGYHRAGVQGPAPLRYVLERLDRKARFARWEDVERIEDGKITLRCRADALEEPPTLR